MQHGLGPSSSLVDHVPGFYPRHGEYLLAYGLGLAQHSACLGIGRISQLVSRLLGHAKHFGDLRVVISTWVGLFPHGWPHRDHHRPKRLQRSKIAPHVHGHCARLLIKLLNMAA
jgi:hypothetical protein